MLWEQYYPGTDAYCITMSMSYAVLLDFFFTLKYLCVCVYTLCVAGAYMCKVMVGQRYSVSCVSCHKTQTIYEKFIRGQRDLQLCKWGWIYFIIQISVSITDTVAHNYNKNS